MIPFEEVLCQLILRHNCVVLPNFGGFVSKTIPAQIDFEKGILQAPYKQLLFNRNLINDDGLVVAEYARLNGLYYQEGVAQLTDFTGKLNADLALGKQVSIPKLGIFTKDADGIVRFEQDRHFNLLLSSYGLSNVTFVPNQVQEETPIIQLNPVSTEESTQKNPTKFWKYAAAACLLPFAFYSFWIPMKTDVLHSGLISYKDFNPLRGKMIVRYAEKQITPFEKSVVNEANIDQQLSTVEPGEIGLYQYDESTVFAVKIPNLETKATAVVETSSVKANFEYIVGCFSEARNANNFVQKLQAEGFNAHILPGGTLIRVSAGSAVNQTEIQAIQSQVNSKGIEGWICKL
ncbi:MAG: SPOR domain-containing protein [Flavobacteriia bacterium]